MTNNKQREEYFRNEANWEKRGEIPSIKVWLPDYPLIKVSKLMCYPIIKIEARLDLGIGEKRIIDKMIVLGYYKSNGVVLNEIYNKTVNQCIDIMRAIDNETKNALKQN